MHDAAARCVVTRARGRSDVALLGLLGDVMLGRSVATALGRHGAGALCSADLVAVLAEADAVVANLECCISTRGERWPDPDKPFFFRAPPVAVELLRRLGVSAVTLANNHALDYGYDALLDTLDLLHDAGIRTTGAGPDLAAARTPATLTVGDVTVALVGCTDHPGAYAATARRPGVALARLAAPADDWVASAIRNSSQDIVVVTPHWGPNMVAAPIRRVRAAGTALLEAGATLVAGHSAHVFHGVEGPILYDLGDFVDDYAVHAALRNDLGLVFLVDVAPAGPRELVAVPIVLDFCHTRLATGDDAAWIRARFTAACRALGTTVRTRDGRLVVDLGSGS
jgi:poly-gamma-glutamate synthesis protein (capsule biosynthesis protein)